MQLTPKNWAEFQHYKDRSPKWIKLHRKLLDDFEYARLPLASRALAPMLWLLASEYEGGVITASLEEMAFRFRVQPGDLAEAIHPLIENGFFASASEVLADCKRDAIPEEEREREREDAAEVAAPTGKFVFESGCIRLTKKSLDDWVAAFSNINVPAELTALADWAGRQPKWFHAVAGALAKRDRQALAASTAAKVAPTDGPWLPSDHPDKWLEAFR